MKKENRPHFLSSIRKHFSNSMDHPNNLSTQDLVVHARNEVYKTVEKDSSLKKYLIGYFAENAFNLPFKIDLQE